MKKLSSTDKILILIAGIPVEIYFLSSPKNAPLRSYFIKGFHIFYGDLIINKEKNIKPQYKIIFEDCESLTTLKQRADLKLHYYVHLFSEKKHEIFTNYHISISQLGLLLRDLMQKILVSNKGFQIHCSSIIAGKKAYVFLGKSGAGKSTISTILSDKYTLFSDDSLAIRKIGNHFYAFQTMEYEKKPIQKFPKGYMLDTIFLLQKSDHYQIKDTKINSKILESILREVWLNENRSINEQIKTYLSILSSEHIKLLQFGLNNRRVVSMFNKFIS